MFSTAETLTPDFRRWEKVVAKKGRYCTKCASHHFDALHSWCEVCRIASRAYKYEYYWDHKKAGLCTQCTSELATTSRCEHHRDYAAAHGARVYHEQREMGLCGYNRCQNHSTAALCETHAEMQREYNVLYRRRRGVRVRGR